MKVSLIDCTGMGTPDPARHAANLLVFTKSTRLTMSPGLMSEIASWDDGKIHQELTYMANTIPSSWEFVQYTFLIEGVSRGFTHQFVRTRTASFAQQTMRVLNVSDGQGWDYVVGPTVGKDPGLRNRYAECMSSIGRTYKALIEDGAAIEDARGVLPTNIQTNIVMGCNLRTLVDLVRKRSSPRTQGEYRDVLFAMKDAVMQVHPWASLFIDQDFDKAARELDAEIGSLKDADQKIRMMKLVDQLRRG